MILLRPENLFSTIHHGTIKIRFRLAAGTTLVVLLAALLFTGAVEIAAAQDIFGRIAGTIQTYRGRGSQRKVTILNESTQIARVLNANKDGYFVADQLPAGAYSVSAEQKGFKTTLRRGNALAAGARLTVDLQLDVGQVTERVVVEAVGDTVNTTSGEISTTITQAQVLDMALNQRHYESLVVWFPARRFRALALTPQP